jgi:hypothetical protein
LLLIIKLTNMSANVCFIVHLPLGIEIIKWIK